jgi:hypothetical protein
MDLDQDDNEDDIGVSIERLSQNMKFDGKNPSLLINPTLFSETYAMSLVAAAIFSFADVRKAARNGKINAPEATVLPLRVMTALQVFADHKDDQTVDGLSFSNIVKDIAIHYFGDEDTNSDCVYLLLESRQLARIVLCFRGSITINDWIKDSKVVVGSIKNPLYMRPHQPPKLGVHLGFREYLYDETKSVTLKFPLVSEKIEIVKKAARDLPQSMKSLLTSNTPTDVEAPLVSANKDSEEESPKTNDKTAAVPSRPDTDIRNNKTNRLSQILEQVGSLRSKREDYRIYVTGHSLGGALAMLTALEVAALWGTTDNPVTFIGIGNPRAATYSFRDAVEILEREGKMRCLGVYNYLDIVPMIPTSALHVRSKNTFCQVGFQMVVHPDKFEMRYCPKMNKSYQDFKDQWRRMMLAIFRPDKIGGRHHYLTYMTRLRDLEEPLSRLHLNDYYNDVVGINLFVGSKKISSRSQTHVTTKQRRFSVLGQR